MDIREFITAHAISATVAAADRNPNMDTDGWAANHWLVTLRRGRQRLAVPYSTGAALDTPDAAHVLDTLASDASGADLTFEDWADEFGVDQDSRKGHRTYQTVVRQTARLRRFLGDDLYRVLLDDTERL